MLAIVLQKDNTTYVTPVLAMKAKGWNSEVIVFDESGKFLKKLSVWHPRRQLFIVQWTNFSTVFSTVQGTWQGESTLVSDKELMKQLRRGKIMPIDKRFAEFVRQYTLPDWFEVKCDADIESLMEVSYDFHDSEIMFCNRRDNLIEIKFDTTWGCFITVRFEGVVKEQGINNLGMILDSEMKFENGMISWQVTDGASGSVGGYVDWNTPFEGATIVCEGVKWSIEIDLSEED